MRLHSLVLLLFVTTGSLATTTLDLSDFDDEAMRNVEDATKELESSIMARDTATAVANAEFIRDSLHWAEGYFGQKGVADAVKLANEGGQIAAKIATHAAASEFDAASDAFGSLKRTCKSCHDAYKPPSL